MLLTHAMLDEFDSWLLHSNNPKIPATVRDQFQTGLFRHNFRINESMFEKAFQLIDRHREKLGDSNRVIMSCELMRAYLQSDLDESERLSTLFVDAAHTLSNNMSFSFPNALPVLRMVCEKRLDHISNEALKRFTDNASKLTASFKSATSVMRGELLGPVNAFMQETQSSDFSTLRQNQAMAGIIKFAFEGAAEYYDSLDYLVTGGIGAHHLDAFVEQLVRVRDLGSKIPLRENDVLVVAQATDQLVRVIRVELDEMRREKLAVGLEALMDICLREEGEAMASKQNYFRMLNDTWANGELCKVIDEASKVLARLPEASGNERADLAANRLRKHMLFTAVQALPALAKLENGLFTEYSAPRFVQAGYKTLGEGNSLKPLSADERKRLIQMIPTGPVLHHLLGQYPAVRRSRVESDFGL